MGNAESAMEPVEASTVSPGIISADVASTDSAGGESSTHSSPADKSRPSTYSESDNKTQTSESDNKSQTSDSSGDTSTQLREGCHATADVISPGISDIGLPPSKVGSIIPPSKVEGELNLTVTPSKSQSEPNLKCDSPILRRISAEILPLESTDLSSENMLRSNSLLSAGGGSEVELGDNDNKSSSESPYLCFHALKLNGDVVFSELGQMLAGGTSEDMVRDAAVKTLGELGKLKIKVNDIHCMLINVIISIRNSISVDYI
jgi:hypothetical protein